MTGARLLIAGIGNIFLGDDAFGVEVARRLAARPQPEGVRVQDFGTRGLDLAFSLLDGCAGAILVDAAARGGAPGTLYVIEPDPAGPDAAADLPEAHGLHPDRVLRLARAWGEPCPWVRVVGCEPLTFGTEDEPALGLSAPVQQAVDEAVSLVESLAREFLDRTGQPPQTEA